MLALLSFLACTATLTVQGPPKSDIYIVKEKKLSKDKAPEQYECHDVEEVNCEVKYFAWETFYWGAYQGQWSKTGTFENEIKPIPAVVGLFVVWPALIWAWGPTEDTVTVQK